MIPNVRRPCTRCTNGWFRHPTQGWAVSCPNCDGPAVVMPRYWIDNGTQDGRVTDRMPPDDHPSQLITPMPDYVRPALAVARERSIARQLVLAGIDPVVA